MITINHLSTDHMSNLLASLEQLAEAGIDPAFDGDCEELERQFAELRLINEHI